MKIFIKRSLLFSVSFLVYNINMQFSPKGFQHNIAVYVLMSSFVIITYP